MVVAFWLDVDQEWGVEFLELLVLGEFALVDSFVV